MTTEPEFHFGPKLKPKSENPPGPKPKPLKKERYGRLVPHTYVGNSTWQCSCDCGRECLVSTTNLNLNRVRSCGCLKWLKNLNYKEEGHYKHNFFKVVGIADSKLVCLCNCNKMFIINSADLHETLSCGCIKATKRHHIPGYNHSEEELYRTWANMRNEARRLGIPIDPKWDSHFAWFWGWALLNSKYAQHPNDCYYLHRLNCQKGFFPENCELTEHKGAKGIREYRRFR